MFRTLRDLLLRPGYMIRDYISGMQMAYFPPFKLLFLLTALWTLVQSGVNLKGTNYLAERHERTVEKYGGQGEDAFDNAFNTVFYNLSEFFGDESRLRLSRDSVVGDATPLSLLSEESQYPRYAFFRNGCHDGIYHFPDRDYRHHP